MNWEIALRPASFAGVPFYWRSARIQGGQRLVVHDIPFAPADLENLGQQPDRFRVTAYFIGETWLIAREAFVATLAKTAGVATLVLPTKGVMRVRVGTWSYSDDSEVGAYGAVVVEFIRDLGSKAPFAATDAASTILSALADIQAQIVAAYAAAMAPVGTIEAAIGYGTTLLTSAASAFAALPQSVFGGISASFAGAVTDFTGTATTVTGSFLSAANAAATVLSPTQPASSPVTGTTPSPRWPADPTYGLAALASWDTTVAAAPVAPTALAAAREAIGQLVDQAAAVAVVALFAQVSFQSTQAAAAARATVTGVLDQVGQNAYDLGQVDLYRGLSALEALSVEDMIVRAQGLPTLATYAERASLPDVVIAQRLYQDGSQGDALSVLNDAIHPLFMPVSGVFLS